MITNHFQTWLLWLQNLSPMAQIVTNYTGDDRRAMAEALSLAAPQGPAGFLCVDECRCDQDRARSLAAIAYSKIFPKLKDHEAGSILAQLESALNADFVAPPRRDFPIDELIEIDVVVRHQTERAISARSRFPKTFDTIRKLLDG